MHQLKRILMNEVDAGSGNGAVPSAPTETAAPAPQAQGDSVTLSKSDLASLIANETQKAVASIKDSIYADARRSAAAKKDPKVKADDPPVSSQAQPDPTRLRALDRALAKGGHAERLSETQYKRIERLYLEETPEDTSGWVRDYFDGLGFAQSPAPVTTQQAAPAKPVTDHPVSNRGAPPPAQVPLEELDLYTASDSDRAAFLKAKGPKAYADLLKKQGKGRSVRFG